MTILLFLFGVAVAAGLFFILADILKLPRLSTEKALLSAGRAEKKRMKSLDAIFLGWAIKLSKFIRMDEYKRHRMERTLSAAGMDMTPEVYLAYTILKPAAALLAVIPCLLIFPLLSPIVVLLSILLYFKESRKAEEKVAERREKIEGELPRLRQKDLPLRRGQERRGRKASQSSPARPDAHRPEARRPCGRGQD